MNVLDNIFFSLAKKVGKFQDQNPGEPVVIASVCRGRMSQISSADKPPVPAKSGILILTPARLILNLWSIPLNSIAYSSIAIINSPLGKKQLLTIQTYENQQFAFAMKYNPQWIEQKYFPLEILDSKEGTSLFVLLIQLAGAAILIYIMMKAWGKYE
jgi:hypothetical protein